jgi:hypothetical protein
MEGDSDMTGLVSANTHLDVLRSALASAYARRIRHIVAINGILFLAIAVIIAGILRFVFSNIDYGALVLAAGAVEVCLIIAIILGLVLHGMALGRMTSIMVGILKTSIDLLTSEIGALAKEIVPGDRSTEQFLDNLDDYMRMNRETDAEASPEAIAKRERLYSANNQIRSVFSELETTQIAVQGQQDSMDMAVFAYGFAIICLLSTTVTAIGLTSTAEFPRVVVIGIGIFCGAACYTVLCRPTNPQFLIEQSLRKLGLSVEVLTDSIRARDTRYPSQLMTDDVFEADAPAHADTEMS